MASSALDFSSDRQMTPKNFALFGTRHFTHLSGGFFGTTTRRRRIIMDLGLLRAREARC